MKVHILLRKGINVDRALQTINNLANFKTIDERSAHKHGVIMGETVGRAVDLLSQLRSLPEIEKIEVHADLIMFPVQPKRSRQHKT